MGQRALYDRPDRLPGNRARRIQHDHGRARCPRGPTDKTESRKKETSIARRTRLSLRASSPNSRVAVYACAGKVMPAHRRLSLRTPRKIDHSYMHEIGPGRHPDTEIAAPIGDRSSDRATIRRVQHQDRRVRKRSCTGDVWPANRCGGAFNNVPRNAGPVARCSYLGPCCGTTDSHKT